MLTTTSHGCFMPLATILLCLRYPFTVNKSLCLLDPAIPADLFSRDRYTDGLGENFSILLGELRKAHNADRVECLFVDSLPDTFLNG